MFGINKWREPKTVFAFTALVLLGVIIIVAILQDRIFNNQWQVSVMGTAKVPYIADTASITLGVQIDKSRTAEIALNELNQSMDQIVDALKTVGVPDEDVQTQNYSLYPQYDYIEGESRLAGYNANQQVKVKVRNLQQNEGLLSKVLAATASAGVNQVHSIQFEASNLEALKQQARILAIQDAQQKAAEMEATLDVNLGKIVGWWENMTSGPLPIPYYAEGKGGMGGGGYDPTIPTGSSELIMEIGVNYLVK